MKKFIRSGLFLVLVVILGLSTACSTMQHREGAGAVRDGIFIHVTHGERSPHHIAMALQMAVIMSESQDVVMYFDIKGPEVLLKQSKDIKYSHFPSSHTQIQRLLDKGVTIYCCPGCLKAAGYNPADLMNGIQVADKDGFFNFTKGRILTLDY